MSETVPITSPAGDPLIGRLIAGRFRILSKLGEGGMGTVYKAEQLLVNRPCAVKILSPLFASDPDALARFHREAQMSSAFSHPHAVTIYDFGDDNGLHYLAMEFVEGETLSAVMKREGPLPLARVLAIARQAAAALDAAHRINIIHRDLKPDNIMLARCNDDDWVKILDFGIAKIAGDAPQRGHDLTQAGFIVGTPLYMSPEQLAGERLDARSDIYSLAIIVYQMLTAQLPFTGDNMQAVTVKRLTEDPLPIQKVNPTVTVPSSVEAALMHALHRQRDRRTRTMRDFIIELESGQPSTTQVQKSDTMASFKPDTSSFPGEEAYRTVPTASPPAVSLPPSPVDNVALPPTVVAGLPVQAGQSGAVAHRAPLPVSAVPSTVLPAAPGPSGNKLAIVLPLVALVVVLVIGGTVGAYYLLWSPGGNRQPSSETGSQPPGQTAPTLPGGLPVGAAQDAFAEGIKSLARKDYVTAERWFRAALDADPKSGKSALNLGIALYHQNKLNDARDRFAEAVRLCADDACKNFAYNYRGRVHWEQREYALAEEDFRQAIVYDANDLSSLAFRGFMLTLIGQTESATQLFDQVLMRSHDENLRSVIRQCKGSALPPVTATDAGVGPGQ